MKIPMTKLEINYIRAKFDLPTGFPSNTRALELRNDANLIFQLKLTLPGVK